MSACLLGATSLIVPALTVALNQYDMLYIFDGPNSESLQVGSGGAIIGATSIPLQALTSYAHTGGTPYCTDGADGSLGKQILTASRWIEDICYQSLWGSTYVNEILTMPTMRAAITRQGNLHFRPRHFPLTTLTSVTVQTNAFDVTSYDPTQAIIDSDQQTVDLSPLAVLSTQTSQIAQASPWSWNRLNRSTEAWVKITYAADFALGGLPTTVERACCLLTNETFAQENNPDGSDQISQNKRSQVFALRGDLTGESLLVKQAKKLLAPYIMQSF